MAKQFSIKGVIEFLGVDKAVAEVKKLDSTVAAMKKNTQQIGKGSQQLGQGLQGIAVGGAAVGAGFGLAIKQASDFEQAMANINSVNELTQAQFKLLERTALQMGATTVFSATEAAEGMFELTKAGLTAEQSVQAIPGVLAAAATEGLGLAQASEIVVSVLQGQNLQMDQATKVADVLAQPATSTAAGITELGEAFKYANQLSAAGLVGFEDTAAALGILSNAGLKGSIAGTSLVAMFNQITKPSKDVQKAFGGINNMMDLFTDKTTGKMKDLPQLIEIIGQAADHYARAGVLPTPVFERTRRAYPMLRYPWADARAALLSLAADQPEQACVQVTYINPETGTDAENILGFYALMLKPGQSLRLPARSPAQVFHVIEGHVEAGIVDKTFQMVEADTCCAPGYEAVTLKNLRADQPSFVFIADESPLHRKLGG